MRRIARWLYESASLDADVRILNCKQSQFRHFMSFTLPVSELEL